jgi:acetyl esterase/lipase
MVTPLQKLCLAVIRVLVPLVLKLTTPRQPSARPPSFTSSFLPTEPPSRKPLQLDVYLPPEHKEGDPPLPIYVNLHGSGFVLTRGVFGNDALFCSWLSEQLPCVVVDAD